MAKATIGKLLPCTDWVAVHKAETPNAKASRPSLRASARVQLRVLHAIFLRELLTRYGRHNIGFLWIFVEPMIFTLGVTALWTATQSVHGSNLPIVAFAITGYSTVLLWRNMPSRCILSVTFNSAIMYHRQVKATDKIQRDGILRHKSTVE